MTVDVWQSALWRASRAEELERQRQHQFEEETMPMTLSVVRKLQIMIGAAQALREVPVIDLTAFESPEMWPRITHIKGSQWSLGTLIELMPGEELLMFHFPESDDPTGMESPEAWR